jgi:hypothetical protein
MVEISQWTCADGSSSCKAHKSEAGRQPTQGMCISAVSQQFVRGCVLILPLDGERPARHAQAQQEEQQEERMYPKSLIFAPIDCY